MIEKVNPAHPDKIADRIAGAIVDMAYKKEKDPRIAVEVLIGHGTCHVISETSVPIPTEDIKAAVHRIAGDGIALDYHEVKQDANLAKNQEGKIRCGDNGIFKGVPLSQEQQLLSRIARKIYKCYPYDGKYILGPHRMIICQSHIRSEAERLRLFVKSSGISRKEYLGLPKEMEKRFLDGDYIIGEIVDERIAF